MKLHLANATGRNVITGYGPGYVSVNAERYESSLVVLPTQLVLDWQPVADGALQKGSIAFLATLEVEIVVLGTGATQRFPTGAVLRPLIDRGIGFEVMDTFAACRTYNILVAEDRRVAAALQI